MVDKGQCNIFLFQHHLKINKRNFYKLSAMELIFIERK